MLTNRLTDALRDAVVAALLRFGKTVAAGETLSKVPGREHVGAQEWLAFLQPVT